MLAELIETEKVHIYNPKSNIVHVSPPLDAADSSALLKMKLPHGWAARKPQGQSKGKMYMKEEHKEYFEALFIAGEKDSGKKMSAALMYEELRSITTGRDVHYLPMISEIGPFISQMAQKRKKGKAPAAAAPAAAAPAADSAADPAAGVSGGETGS